MGPRNDQRKRDVPSSSAGKSQSTVTQWGDKNLFSPSLVEKIFSNDIRTRNSGKISSLEMGGYLEGYLWPHWSASASAEHLLSLVVLLNDKYFQGVPAFKLIAESDERFASFFERVADLFVEGGTPSEWLCDCVLLLTNAFKSMEIETVRRNTLRYLSLPLWTALSETRRRRELEKNASMTENWRRFQTHWQAVHEEKEEAEPPAKKGKRKQAAAEEGDAQKQSEKKKAMRRDCELMPSLVRELLACVEARKVAASARLLELFIEVLSQLPTRRFLTVLLDDAHVLLSLRRSALYEESPLVRKLVHMLQGALVVPLDDVSGSVRTRAEVLEETQNKFLSLQRLAFSQYPTQLQDIVHCSLASLSSRESLEKAFALLSDEELASVARSLEVLTEKDSPTPARDWLLDLLSSWLLPELSVVFPEDALQHTPVYPTEATLWDEDMLPANSLGRSSCDAQAVYALPKLNLQFLSVHDYLMRNYELFRLESAYEIREDIVDALRRLSLSPQPSQQQPFSFSGFSRMITPVAEMAVNDVARPRIGEEVPAQVTCTVTIDLSRFSGDARAEWEALREHDVLFLLCIENPMSSSADNMDNAEEEVDIRKRYGIKYVRGAVLFEYRDEADVVLNDFSRPDERAHGRVGHKRKLRLRLDAAQYVQDTQRGLDCYEKFNFVLRRDPRQNNFKAVLDTMRSLLSSASLGRAIPRWLQDVFLGYGDPASANYRKLSSSNIEETDYADTFVSVSHIVESFPRAKKFVLVRGEEEIAVGRESASSFADAPPYKLRIVRADSHSAEKDSVQKKKKKKTAEATQTASQSHGEDCAEEEIAIIPYAEPLRGPYPEDRAPHNTVRFTPAQVDAIRSGLSPGLSLIVGPPGTGKTDVAVQIIATLYHNHPTQRILVVTHSNAALNDIFEKIMDREVDARHMLRLGSGEAELRDRENVGEVAEMFSKVGRVNASLRRRLELLAQAQRLSFSLGLQGDVGASCETAEIFYANQVKPRIDKFSSAVASLLSAEPEKKENVRSLFPFNAFFADVPSLFSDSESLSAEDMRAAQGCVNHIERVFAELRDYRALELLRTQNLRCDFLLTKQARIVAMTCTHAAMTRSRLVELGFHFDSVVMEEAAQILEVETLLPIVLQDVSALETHGGVQRVVLLGDHQQLPPIVQHQVLQRHCRLEQSMFARFVRLGVPAVQLDMQGRARAELSALYSWRYRSLGDMVHVSTNEAFLRANAGLVFTHQWVDVGDLHGKGETARSPHAYENRAEAEYVVALFQYMRLLGYPAEKISMLTTYNGQRQLLQDLVAQRCAKNPLFGRPAHISTVDKFQGQQNDYVLLSLVRTEALGHLRDLRRLVVALSRARLGLYVFGRSELWRQAVELRPALDLLCPLGKPLSLSLIAGESFPTARSASETVDEGRVLNVEDVTAMGVLVYQMVQQSQFMMLNQQHQS